MLFQKEFEMLYIKIKPKINIEPKMLVFIRESIKYIK